MRLYMRLTMRLQMATLTLFAIVTFGFAYPAFAGDTVGLPAPTSATGGAFPAQKHYSPYAGRNFPTQVFWGDTHLHTGMSMDAGAFGARLLDRKTPTVLPGAKSSPLPQASRLSSTDPSTFLVVADHSDNMGFFPRLFEGDPEMLADPTGKKWYEMVQAGGQKGVQSRR